MRIDARIISEHQSCRRKTLLGHDYRLRRWRTKSLFDACLRRAIFTLSSGADPISVSSDAQAQFMQTAADPGLDLPAGANPYKIAKDHCAMLSTIIISLSKLILLTLREPRTVALGSSATWHPLSWADESGALHRWITVDRWGTDELAREGHSWYVLGDIAVSRVPMTLHVIEIGQQRKGRRASPWARAWQHPGLPNRKLRFLQKDGTPFHGWKPVYLADVGMDVGEWVETMWTEGAAQALLHHVEVVVPPNSVCDDTVRQILWEAAAIRELVEERASGGYLAQPMSRGACDAGHVACPFQEICYSVTPVDVLATGLYVPKKQLIAV